MAKKESITPNKNAFHFNFLILNLLLRYVIEKLKKQIFIDNPQHCLGQAAFRVSVLIHVPVYLFICYRNRFIFPQVYSLLYVLLILYGCSIILVLIIIYTGTGVCLVGIFSC
jgi:hypothetical protein